MNDSLKTLIFNHPFFRGMNPEYLEILATHAAKGSFPADRTLFREGEPADKLYLLQSGRVVLEAHEPCDGTVRVQTLKGGEALGWSWLFPPFVWHLQARTLDKTDAIILDGAHMMTVAERNHEFGYELMKRVARVVIERLQATRKQLLGEQIEAVLEG